MNSVSNLLVGFRYSGRIRWACQIRKILKGGGEWEGESQGPWFGIVLCTERLLCGLNSQEGVCRKQKISANLYLCCIIVVCL